MNKEVTIFKEVRDKMDGLYGQFVKDNQSHPGYAECMVQFNDSGDTLEVTIKLSCDVAEEEDDRIFYYCDGLEDLKGLAEEGRGSDFIVTDIFSFQEQL